MWRAGLLVDYVLLVRANNEVHMTLIVQLHQSDIHLLTNILSPLLQRNVIQVARVLHIANFLQGDFATVGVLKRGKSLSQTLLVHEE